MAIYLICDLAMPSTPAPPSHPKKPIRWRTGPSAGRVGVPEIPVEQENALRIDHSAENPSYQKSRRGRPRKKPETPSEEKDWHPDRRGMVARDHGEAGRLAWDKGHFLRQMSTGCGSSLDMLALAHGAIGCGAYALTQRFHPPGFLQGIESFTALDACTNLTAEDLENNGDDKLARAIDEARVLFPLTHGMTIVNEEPIGLLGGNVQGIVKTKAAETKGLLTASSYGFTVTTDLARISALRTVQAQNPSTRGGRYDIALTGCGDPSGLVWIIDKLLRDIGLNPIHAYTSPSAMDLVHVSTCKLIVKSIARGDILGDLGPGSSAHPLLRLLGVPMVWGCFIAPSAIEATLRRIASHFDAKIQRRTEDIIAFNRKKIEAVIACYRPRLEGKLFLNLCWLRKEAVEPLRLLGLRVGDREGWIGKTGVPRKPRIALKWDNTNAFDAYLEETKADIAYFHGISEYEWRKRGLAGLPHSCLFDDGWETFSGYDGFEVLAVTLDRHINAPWRKLVKPPWSQDSG